LSIRPLDLDIVQRIAAGEVIDSLAAAVRELVENSIDAGATRLQLSVQAEQWQLRLTDNGLGMGLADLQVAATAHSTSKLPGRDLADLWRISSLGFRGEALHSLAQLGALTIASRPIDQPEGWRLTYDRQGQPVEQTSCAMAPGTIVTVDQLFANLSARRQSLPSLAQQLRSIQLICQQIALCHPSLTWQAEQAGKPWFSIWPGQSPQQILPQLLRDVTETDLRWVVAAGPDRVSGPEAEESELNGSNPTISNPTRPEPIATAPHLDLLLGLPDRCHRRRPDWIKIAVRGRVVRLPELEQTILSQLRRMVPRDRFPVCWVHLWPDPGDLDWNRHPAKVELFVRHLDRWQQSLAAAIAQALSLDHGDLEPIDAPQRLNLLLKTAEQGLGYLANTDQAELVLDESDSSSTPTSPDRTTPTSPALQPLKAIGQVHNTYIVTEHAQGLWLVEQHIAHERVLYEQLVDRWHCETIEPLIIPDLKPHQVEQLQRIGLDLAPFGDSSWAARSIPATLVDRDDRLAALIELSQVGDLQTAQVATACRSAIRNGTPMSLAQMQQLLNQWQRSRNPHTCPHGRPIYLALDETSLSRFFRRHWVIGKSHGI
jgi:DNA mismatch repair protein MutL